MEHLKKSCMNENTFENWLVGVVSIMTGLGHYTILQIQTIPAPFWVSLLKSGLTAFVCAFLGMTAKWVFNKISKNKQ